MIFLDSNIVIDLMDPRSDWSPWSRSAVEAGSESASLVANIIVVAETAARFDPLEHQLAYLADLGVELRDVGNRAAHRAGLAHKAYRRAGGPRESVLADFLIGGHASVLNARLLTRDRQRFAGYFPELTLITPETHP